MLPAPGHDARSVGGEPTVFVCVLARALEARWLHVAPPLRRPTAHAVDVNRSAFRTRTSTPARPAPVDRRDRGGPPHTPTRLLSRLDGLAQEAEAAAVAEREPSRDAVRWQAIILWELAGVTACIGQGR